MPFAPSAHACRQVRALHAGVERAVLARGDRQSAPATSASRARCAPARPGGPSGPSGTGGSGGPSPGGNAVSPARPGDAEVALDAHVVGLEVLVGQRPVVGDAVERPHAEVRRHVALPLRRVDDRAAADAVPHQRRDVGLGVVDRVVARRLARVRVPAPVAARGQREVGSR